MKKIFVSVAMFVVFAGSLSAHSNVCVPPMNNVPNPSVHIPSQHNFNAQYNHGGSRVCPQPGLYWSQPVYTYPVVPLYPPLVQPQETIYVDTITAEGLNLSDGRSRRVQFYIGRCANGQIWCQAGVTPSRFFSEQEAYRFVERIFCLRDFSLREVYRHANGTRWYVN